MQNGQKLEIWSDRINFHFHFRSQVMAAFVYITLYNRKTIQLRNFDDLSTFTTQTSKSSGILCTGYIPLYVRGARLYFCLLCWSL